MQTKPHRFPITTTFPTSPKSSSEPNERLRRKMCSPAKHLFSKYISWAKRTQRASQRRKSNIFPSQTNELARDVGWKEARDVVVFFGWQMGKFCPARWISRCSTHGAFRKWPKDSGRPTNKKTSQLNQDKRENLRRAHESAIALQKVLQRQVQWDEAISFFFYRAAGKIYLFYD